LCAAERRRERRTARTRDCAAVGPAREVAHDHAEDQGGEHDGHKSPRGPPMAPSAPTGPSPNATGPPTAAPDPPAVARWAHCVVFRGHGATSAILTTSGSGRTNDTNLRVAEHASAGPRQAGPSGLDDLARAENPVPRVGFVPLPARCSPD
jgi:hypothetical protein